MTSTFEKLMQNPKFKNKFDSEYTDFLLSELICAMMEEDEISVRKLAKKAGLSASFIQNLKSGKQKDIKLTKLLNLTSSLGYDIVLRKNGEEIQL